MAKGMTFNSIMSDLKARKFSPVYILMGEEAYYIDLIADYIAEHVLTPDEQDFNQTVVYGADTTAVQVADIARRYPMMAEFQVVIVKEAQSMRRPVFEYDAKATVTQDYIQFIDEFEKGVSE